MTPAPALIRWLLRRFGKVAITLPWGRVYCLPEYEHDQRLWLHEQAHLNQIKRDGAVRWTAKILWQYLCYGYKDAPYEREAREIAGR